MYSIVGRSFFMSSFLCLALLLLPGCGRFICHVKNLFVSAGKVCMSLEDIQCKAVRTVSIRPDGLMTLETIRFLYKSDEVIEFYERLEGDCAGERDEIVEKKIKEQQRMNTEKTIFFVSLYGLKADWAFTLVKDGHVYKTAEVNVIDLDRNYKAIFGVSAVRYRQHIYQLSFDASVKPPFEVAICNGEYTSCVTWE